MGTGSTHSRKQQVEGRGVAARGRLSPAEGGGRQRTISVGIAEGERIEFALPGQPARVATVSGEMVVIDGESRAEWVFTPGVPNGGISTPLGTKTAQNVPNGSFSAPLGTLISSETSSVIPGEDGVIPSTSGVIPSEVEESPDTLGAYFTLKNVEIGKGFHWQRRQDQSFRGSLRLIAREGRVIAINIVGIEDYLQCVIASEMSPTAGFEFLKAHAVISRSWLLAQLDKRDEVRKEGYSAVECGTPEELIRWQDREDHKYYDFCADDHCQRYQGIPMAIDSSTRTCGLGRNDKRTISGGLGRNDKEGISGESHPVIPSAVEESARLVDPAMIRKTARVIEATWGQVLTYGGRVCDARFSKCCGGALEEFKYCWENKEVPYLKYALDYSSGADEDLREEKAARRWIMSKPRAFCNTRSKRLLGQVLKDYDSETKDFYRWKVEYTAEELRQIILERTGEEYGKILDLIPLERGVSGRICRLKIVGSAKTKIIGKELEIRKTLSRSHLYSSAFIVEKVYSPELREEKVCAAEGVAPAKFILHGAGWGHGVGLCQIGAAAMGARGYDYRTILAHYYPNSEIKDLQPQDASDGYNSHLVATKTPFSEENLPQDDSGTQNGHLVSNT